VLADDTGIGGIPAYQVLGDLRHPSVYEDRYIDEIFYADCVDRELIEAADRAAGARRAIVAPHRGPRRELRRGRPVLRAPR
jgi:hypothetical protein